MVTVREYKRGIATSISSFEGIRLSKWRRRRTVLNEVLQKDKSLPFSQWRHRKKILHYKTYAKYGVPKAALRARRRGSWGSNRWWLSLNSFTFCRIEPSHFSRLSFINFECEKKNVYILCQIWRDVDTPAYYDSMGSLKRSYQKH